MDRDMDALEERKLVLSCLRGEPEEFKKIVDVYSAPLMALALNILGNREDAQDACQDTFLRAYLHLASFDVNRSLKTWLMTILYRRCLDRLRMKRRFRAFIGKAAWENPGPVRQASLPAASDPEPLPPKILDLLSSREKIALCLWANEGYTAEEISRVIRCSASTARVYLFNARKKIKARLEKDHAVLSTG